MSLTRRELWFFPSLAGIYKILRTVYIGSNTSLIFGNKVVLQKTDKQGSLSHVIVNKGAKSKTYDQNILVEGFGIMVNDIEIRDCSVAYILHSQLSFFLRQGIAHRTFLLS
jgi:hypothetical protein